MRRVKLAIAAFFVIASLALGVTGTVQPVAAKAASSTACANPNPTFLTFPAWYRGLVDKNDPNCTLLAPGVSGAPTLANYVWIIVLNGIDIALQLVAYVTVFMILWGGFQFMNNGGEPSAVVAARKTIINAAVGLGASMASIAAVNLIFGLIS